jgi:hypothetical protein
MLNSSSQAIEWRLERQVERVCSYDPLVFQEAEYHVI